MIRRSVGVRRVWLVEMDRFFGGGWVVSSWLLQGEEREIVRGRRQLACHNKRLFEI